MELKQQNALDAGFHMPAEWEPHKRCWMAWPASERIWGEYLERSQQAYGQVAQAIAAFEPLVMLTPPGFESLAARLCGPRVVIVSWDLDDAWMRDIGPNFLKNAHGETAASVFQFNAWGRKYPHYRKDAALGNQLAETLDLRSFTSPLYLEGGAINVDGEGTLLTTRQCVLNDNRNPGLTEKEAEELLCHALGVYKVIWLPGDPLDEETDGHVDGLACFVRPGAVLAAMNSDPTTEDYRIFRENARALELATDARGRKLEIMYIEEHSETEVCDRFCRSYINFYIANGGIVMPEYGNAADARARQTVQACFPDRVVSGVDINHVAYGGGGIHCITQQEPV